MKKLIIVIIIGILIFFNISNVIATTSMGNQSEDIINTQKDMLGIADFIKESEFN